MNKNPRTKTNVETANREVWKFPISDMTYEVEMPKEADVLTVQLQDERICLWAEVTPNAELERRRFHVVGTGWKVPADSFNYIGTVQRGALVWHIYEGEIT